VLPTKLPSLRRPVAIICALVLLRAAGDLTYNYFACHASVAALVLAVPLVGLVLGILKDRPFALRTVSFLCVLTAFILPFGINYPLAVGSHLAQGRQSPTVMTTLLWLVPIEFVLLFVAFLVDPRTLKRNSKVDT
jgi:hypothetical protein